jgi:type IV pilus assembly protein PilV
VTQAQSIPCFRHAAGFAMIDTLIALLLLAIVVLTACFTLGRSLRATNQALFSSRGVDVAADLVEALHAQPGVVDFESLAAAARDRAATSLPPAAQATATGLIDLAATLRGAPAP